MIREINIIIATNKNLVNLKNLIYQLLNQKGKFSIKILIIHQSSKNEPIPKFIYNKKIFYKKIQRQNLSNAKNIGIKLSKSNIIGFLDDDVTLSKNYLLDNWDFIRKNKCDLLFSRINIINTKKPFSRNMRLKDMKINYLNAHSCLSSSMWMVKSKNNNAIYFDTKFGLGSNYGSGEETDYVFRSLMKNKKILYSSKVNIFHPKPISEKNNYLNNFKKFYLYGRGQGALIKKHKNKNLFLFYIIYLSSFFKSILGCIFFGLTLNFKNSLKYLGLFLGKLTGYLKYK